MRNLLALIGLLVVGFLGIGWYMGWYKFSFTKSEDGTLQIKTDVKTDKVASDSTEFLKNVGAVIGNHVDKAAKDATTSAPTTAPGGTPGPVTTPQNTQPNPNTPLTPGLPGGPIPLFPPKSN